MSIPLSLQAIQTTLVKMGHEVGNDTAVTTADFAKSIEPLLFSMQDGLGAACEPIINWSTLKPNQKEVGLEVSCRKGLHAPCCRSPERRPLVSFLFLFRLESLFFFR